VEPAFRRVDWNVVEVDAEPIALRVAVRKETCLKHPVRRKSNAGHDVGGRKGSLFHFREIILRIAIKLHHGDFDQRILRLRPHLGEIEGIVAARLRLLLGHHLDEEGPAREVASLDRLEQVAAISRSVATIAAASASLRLAMPLLRPEVKLDPDALIRGIDHREGVAAEQVDVAEALRDPAIGHDDGDSVQRLGEQRPEIPLAARAAQAGAPGGA
jgi:hypothetical protein